MNRRARTMLLTAALAIFLAKPAMAQVVMQPTPNPTVTAENEPWYLNGDPITHAGSLYYPVGPRVDFNADEMVRSGFFMGIPLYARTTIEPYSVVYVPVGPAVMQPYERLRTGALAETAGSLPRSLPPVPGADIPVLSTPAAAGPPSQTTTVVPVQVPRPVGTSGVETPAPAGRVSSPAAAPRRVVTPRRPTHTRIGDPPQGTNAIFIEFQGARWYMAGPAEPIDLVAMRRAGTYMRTPVWSKRGADDGIIWVPVTQGGGSLAVPYSRTK